MLIRLEYESCLLHATSTPAQYFLVQGWGLTVDTLFMFATCDAASS